MSLNIKENISLKQFNSFNIDASVKYFTKLNNLNNLPEIINSTQYKNNKTLLLGGGSNILLTNNIDNVLVIKIETRGIRLIEQNDNQVIVEVAAGESWSDFVQYALAHSWFCLENLSLIPGTVGAAPVQNIGAYGVEVKDCIDRVICADLNQNGRQITFNANECEFSYRNSRFKQEQNLLISAVRFRLSKVTQVKTQYGDIQQELSTQGHAQNPSAQQVAQAIIALRQRKLPDPNLLANVGSFFKNPIIDGAQAKPLISKYPKLVHYPIGNGQVKLAAGWLIDNAGLKGFRVGDVAVHEKQALVLVNYAKASGQQIIQFANHIQEVVQKLYGVALEIEPRIIS